jgi:proline dehydrogenase
MISRILYLAARKMAPAYIAGPRVEDAIGYCRKINALGWTSTVCPWDGPGDSSETVLASYRQALIAIRKEGLDTVLSIKVPSLDYDAGRVRELAAIAAESGVRIHFDALGPETASASLELLEKTAQHYPNLGYTLPARWKRSAEDARQLADLGVTIRIVKGQWADPVEASIDPAENFFKLAAFLSGKPVRVAVATHDAALARKSLAVVSGSGTPVELEQLFGLPICANEVAAPFGIGTRVYIPYGHAYLPYAFSEIRKRPVILGWLARDLIVGRSRRLPV